MKSEDTPIQGEIAERGNAEAGTSFSWLWVPALLFFGFGDTLTSYLVFAAGGREANPLLAAVTHPFGGGMTSFVVVKAIILVALVLLSWYGLKKQGWIVPAALSILGGYLVGHNILSLGGLK